MSLDEEHSTTILKLGGIEYAFQKLERRKAEGPTERNRDIVRFLVGYGSMPSGRMLTLINLALEWGDFAMWEMIQNGKYTPQLSSDIVIRAWGAFTFDRTKHVLVCSSLRPFCHSPFSLFNIPLQNREGYSRSTQHKSRARVYPRPSGACSYPRPTKYEGVVETADHHGSLIDRAATKHG